jgi:hypothetical protein
MYSNSNSKTLEKPDNRTPIPQVVGRITFTDFPPDYCDQIRKAAHAAIKAGYSVVRLKPGLKVPVDRSNPDKSRMATTDHKIVDEWWPQGTLPQNTYGLGIRTGNGLGIVDVDVKGFHDGKNPHGETVNKYLADFPIQITSPRGGNGGHTPFHNRGMNTALKVNAIDLICEEKSFVVAPPTMLITTEDYPGGKYTYRHGSKTYGDIAPDELPPLSVELISILDSWRPKVGRKPDPKPLPALALGGESAEFDGYVLDRCRRYLESVEHHQAGHGGHNAIIRAACVIAGDFGIRGSEGLSLLSEWNERSTHPDGPETQKQIAHKWEAALVMTESNPQTKRREAFVQWLRRAQAKITSPASTPKDDGDNRTPILVRKGEEHRVADEIAAALTKAGVPLYRQDAHLKVIYQAQNTNLAGDTGNAKWSTSRERTVVGTVKLGWLRKRISEHCRLYVERTDKNGEVFQAPTDTNQSMAEMLAQSPERFPHLAGLALGPIVGIDDAGRLLNKQGYDPESHLYLADAVPNLVIPELCSLEDARKAEREIWKLVSGFPWRDVAVDYPRWLAMLFTAAMRHQLTQVPIGLITSTTPGSGKSLLAVLIGKILHGTSPTTMSWVEDKDGGETRKRLASLCHAAESFVLFDDLRLGLEFNSGELRQFITGDEYHDRLLGQNTGAKAGGPQRCQLIFTGNAVTPQGDMVQRVLVCSLKPDDPLHRLKDPAKAWPEVGDAMTYAENNRTKLLGAVLTIVRAFRQAGSPFVEGQAYAFHEWTRQVCCLVRWLTGHDPLAGIALEWKEIDTEACSLRDFIECWHDAFGTQTLSASEIVNRVYGTFNELAQPEIAALREIIPQLMPCRDNCPPTPHRIGRFFRNYADRTVETKMGNYCLTVAKKHVNGKNGAFGVKQIAQTASNPHPFHPLSPFVTSTPCDEVGNSKIDSSLVRQLSAISMETGGLNGCERVRRVERPSLPAATATPVVSQKGSA